MKVKTSELSGVALDWAVAKAEWLVHEGDMRGVYIADYSIDWNHAGPIIERECITLRVCPIVKTWRAFIDTPNAGKFSFNSQSANSPLIAAMQCYVASKLGDVVDIPGELMEVTK